MATQTIQFRSPPSQTVTLRLFVAGSDTQIASAAATEATNRKGTYEAAFTDVPAAEYQYIATIGTSPIIPVASGYVLLTLTTATFQVYDAAKAVNLSEVPSPDSGAIAEAVAQYDQRDEDGTPGTIGWYFKKLRQANNTVEAVVTNDVTPTATTFSVALTTYPTGAFKHAVLAVVEDGNILDQNSPILTFTNNTTYSTIVLEEAFTQAPAVGDVMLINVVSHVHSVASIAAGVWGATSSAYSAATGTFGYWANAISTMIEYVGGFWRFNAGAVELVNQATTGDWSITRTFQVAGGAKVPGVRMSLVGVDGKTATTGTNGIATIKADDGTFTLRVVVPVGYQDVADTTVTINGADSTATVTLVATTTPAPPSPDACVLSIYVRNQATEPFPGVTVTGRFPRGWSVADGAMNINEVVTDTTDANGLAQLILLRDQDYDLSFARENGTIAKIRITTPDAATATLNQSYQG